MSPDGGFTLGSCECVGLTGRCRPPAAGHARRTEDASRPPSRMAAAAMTPAYFAVDFDRATGIFWDVPDKLGRGAAFWTIASPPAGTPLKHDVPLFRTREGRLVGEV